MRNQTKQDTNIINIHSKYSKRTQTHTQLENHE